MLKNTVTGINTIFRCVVGNRKRTSFYCNEDNYKSNNDES